MKTALLAVLALASVSARAADKPIRVDAGPKAEDALRRFVAQDPRFKKTLDGAAEREEAVLASNRDADLRDAVADQPGPDELRRRLSASSGADRTALLNQLPGLKAPIASSCAALADCGHPDLALEAPDAERLPDAVRALVRPWLLVQNARGRALELTPVDGSGDAALRVSLRGVDAAPLVLNISPKILGGFKVWFDRPLELAALYERERRAALNGR